jgi:hypothetical protein
MSNAPLMPMATAVWLVENTTLTFKQIADFCKFMKLKFKVLLMVKLQKVLKLIIQLFLDNFLEKKLNYHQKMKIDL